RQPREASPEGQGTKRAAQPLHPRHPRPDRISGRSPLGRLHGAGGATGAEDPGQLLRQHKAARGLHPAGAPRGRRLSPGRNGSAHGVRGLEVSSMSQAPELGMTSALDHASVEDPQIHEIENKLLQGIFGCRSGEAVEAAITYASFLSSAGITPENYPVFLKMLEVENHWVIDALIGSRDPFLLLSSVQPNRFIVERVLAMMTRWHKRGIYPKNLSVILGVLQSVYSSARDGYRIYPLTIADSNALGKHLDKNKGQDDPLNRAILEVLEKIAELESEADPQME